LLGFLLRAACRPLPREPGALLKGAATDKVSIFELIHWIFSNLIFPNQRFPSQPGTPRPSREQEMAHE
jgi:hypothetical protein